VHTTVDRFMYHVHAVSTVLSYASYVCTEKEKEKEIALPSHVCSEGPAAICSFVVPHCLSFTVVPCSLLFLVPHCSLFPIIHHPSWSLLSAPPYLSMRSSSQAGWWCCVMWHWWWSSLDRKRPLPPCEQRLAAAAQGVCDSVGGQYCSQDAKT
jgi:hypothetical protein